MKISVFREDEGFDNYLKYRPVVVYVNGEILSNVVRLDTDEGWAEFNVKGADGLFMIENGEIVSDIAEGLVELHMDGAEIGPLPSEPEEEIPGDAEPESPVTAEDQEIG